MISASRVGRSFSPDRRFLISSPQSGMFDPRDAVARLDELPPGAALRRQDFPARGSQAVIAAAALSGALHPAPLNPAAPLQAVQERVERGDVEPQRPPRTLLDQAADVVAVPRPLLDQREDQQLGTPLLQLARENV